MRILGDGPPVLLVHGISADHSEWIRVAEGLAGDHRVIVPDLLGRGASRPYADADFSLAAETDRLVAIVEAVGVERPLVGGHSAGASLALSLARRIPVAGLLLVSPVTPWTPRPRILD
ncbi:MAG: alpha/beta fold hydrolase, partial [Gemmatimonadota bacterium]